MAGDIACIAYHVPALSLDTYYPLRRELCNVIVYLYAEVTVPLDYITIDSK